MALAHGRSTPGSENGRFWGEEVILRPFFHWQCQLGTVPYTVPYFAVITVKYGVTITVVRRNITSTVRTVQTVTVPYRTTRQAWYRVEKMEDICPSTASVIRYTQNKGVVNHICLDHLYRLGSKPTECLLEPGSACLATTVLDDSCYNARAPR